MPAGALAPDAAAPRHARLTPRRHTAVVAAGGSASALRGPHDAPAPSPEQPSRPPPLPPRPRLQPPPPPLSWPDYPYSRRPAASACGPSDESALKLEALFQSVLHYPRAPPKLIRFLRRATPGGVSAQLPAITSSVEALSDVLGREVAVYLIRRKPWVVMVPAEAIGDRMDSARRLLGLPGPAVLDLLRKNPNLLRMERDTLRQRYEALHPATGFGRDQVRALVIKYPLILNYKPESIASAAVALRRLCSARPSWAAHHAALSPSQFAFFMRDRVHTLLRLEYLLLTGAGGSWTLRDIIKVSNNVFKKTHSGFRFWMMERLRRLRERLMRARAAATLAAAAEASAAARTSPAAAAAPPGRLHRRVLERIDDEVEARTQEEERQQFLQAYMERRRRDQAEMERREEQRRRAVELKEQQKLAQQQAEAEAQGQAQAQGQDWQAGPGADSAEWATQVESEANAEWERREQLRRHGGAAGQQRDAAARPAAQPPSPHMAAAAPAPPRGDVIASVTPGQVWRRPGSQLRTPPSSPPPPPPEQLHPPHAVQPHWQHAQVQQQQHGPLGGGRSPEHSQDGGDDGNGSDGGGRAAPNGAYHREPGAWRPAGGQAPTTAQRR